MSKLAFPDLENLYDELATALDEAGPANANVFLAKLVLCMAHEWGDAPRISQLIQTCQHEPLPAPAAGVRLL